MFKDTKAVSPVIGIMLMLVVTVILAAAVSSTSTGLMKSSEAAPMAVFDVKVVKDVEDRWGNVISYIQIKQVTGDSIPTNNLKMVVTANGTITETLPNSNLVNYENTVWGTITTGSAPFLNNPGVGYYGNPKVDFGNYTLRPGVTMVADQSSNYEGNTSLKTVIGNWDELSKGDFINVKIIHLPTQKVIFNSDAEVV